MLVTILGYLTSVWMDGSSVLSCTLHWKSQEVILGVKCFACMKSCWSVLECIGGCLNRVLCCNSGHLHWMWSMWSWMVLHDQIISDQSAPFSSSSCSMRSMTLGNTHNAGSSSCLIPHLLQNSSLKLLGFPTIISVCCCSMSSSFPFSNSGSS